jgi:MOSC domain-containing protein YiiM
MTGRLEGIWVKRAKRGPMDAAETASLVAGRGLAGGVGQSGLRQVTILSRETWERLTHDLPGPPEPGVRRANLMVSGVDLAHSRNKLLSVGRVRIRIVGETRPCEQMDVACPGLRSRLEEPWGGGAFGEVLDDGEITLGDPVTLTDAPLPAAGPGASGVPQTPFRDSRVDQSGG